VLLKRVPPPPYGYDSYYKRRRHVLNESSEIVPNHMYDYATTQASGLSGRDSPQRAF